jgi:hypothetical protein
VAKDPVCVPLPPGEPADIRVSVFRLVELAFARQRHPETRWLACCSSRLRQAPREASFDIRAEGSEHPNL